MSIKRTIYLETVPLPQAIQSVREAVHRDGLVLTENIPSHEAAGRVLCKAVYARYSSPTVHSAAMDGYAVIAADTFGAREGHSLTLPLGERCVPVNTGQALPGECDAVIMIEQIQEVDAGHIRIEAPAFPWQHVRRIGEDIVATELLFPRNHVLCAYDVGALLSGGIWEVPVWERLRIRIIPTGDEVLDFTLRPEPGRGEVVESNAQVILTLARQLGGMNACLAERSAPVPDNPESLHAALLKSLDAGNHVTIFCAGSSAGSKDFTRAVIEREGHVLVHGIAMMPGKPSLAGLCRGRLVFGAPGYPVSSVLCFEEFISPLLCWLARIPERARPVIPVEITRKLPSRLGMEEFIRLAVGKVGHKAVGIPLGRGAGNITTLTRAQAITRIPAQSEGLAEGSTVQAELTVSEHSLDSVLICVGSHDNTLDVLADELMGLSAPCRLVSTHVGSMGGITALAGASCHMAGMHLLDEDTGDFNFSFLDKYLPGGDVLCLNLAIRHQGLIVAKGNPKHIQGVEDLNAGGLRYINRQRGAGTRILFDWHLTRAGISTQAVNGYGKEESTHMAVAVNVLTGAADCGMGIFAAAQALGLDFVPLARERYDIVIPRIFWDDSRIQAVRAVLASASFKDKVTALGGYETTLTGTIMQPGIKLG